MEYTQGVNSSFPAFLLSVETRSMRVASGFVSFRRASNASVWIARRSIASVIGRLVSIDCLSGVGVGKTAEMGNQGERVASHRAFGGCVWAICVVLC